jgi:hypothetical protein
MQFTVCVQTTVLIETTDVMSEDAATDMLETTLIFSVVNAIC